jgi:hypothetical protein
MLPKTTFPVLKNRNILRFMVFKYSIQIVSEVFGIVPN